MARKKRSHKSAEDEVVDAAKGCLTAVKGVFRVTASVFFLLVLLSYLPSLLYPLSAWRHGVGLIDMLVRAVDPHALDPLYYLEPRSTREARLASLGQGRTLKVEILPGEAALARRELESFYPPKNKKAWEDLQAWGRTLFLQLRFTAGEKADWSFSIPSDSITEDGHLWFAWKRLRAACPSDGKELPQLLTLTRAAFPSSDAYDKALTWARDFHTRLTSFAESPSPVHVKNVEEWNQLRAATSVTMPPATEWTLCWLLYTHVGVTSSSQEAVRKRWESYFQDNLAPATRWGERLLSEREEPLPPLPDQDQSLYCAAERVLGLDSYGVRCREAASSCFRSPGGLKVKAFSLSVGSGTFPNDELYFRIHGDRVGTIQDYFGGGASAIFHVLSMLILFYGMGLYLLALEEGFGLKDNPVYRRYRRRRRLRFLVSHPVLLLWFAVLLLCATFLACLGAPLEVRALLSPGQLVFSAFMMVLLGGLLFQFLGAVVAAVLIHNGKDPTKSWLDEIIVVPIGILLLLWFGNDLLSVMTYAALTLALEVTLRVYWLDGVLLINNGEGLRNGGGKTRERDR